MTNLEMYALLKAEGGSSTEAKETLKALIDKSIAKIDIPAEVMRIGGYVFYRCLSLTSITIPGSVVTIEHNAFRECSNLTTVYISNGVTQIGTSAFNGCSNLTTLFIPNSATIDSLTVFRDCNNLENVILEPGFNAKNLDLSSSTLYSVETLVAMLNALADRTGQTAYSLTLGSINLAKLSNEQIAIATQKNWTLA